MESEQVVKLDMSDLLPGDVLLYRPRKPCWHQRCISKETDSPYTHAAIYLGDGYIADSTFPCGVKKRPLITSMNGTLRVAVLRSQYCFCGNRPQELKNFIDHVLSRRRPYNLLGVLGWKKKSKEFFNYQIDNMLKSFGEFSSNEVLSGNSFFCSALIVACYAAVGIISRTAQCAYPKDVFSPAQLHRDPTFGWLLGILSERADGFSDVEKDPVFIECTNWSDFDAAATDPNGLKIKWWL